MGGNVNTDLTTPEPEERRHSRERRNTFLAADLFSLAEMTSPEVKNCNNSREIPSDTITSPRKTHRVVPTSTSDRVGVFGRKLVTNSKQYAETRSAGSSLTTTPRRRHVGNDNSGRTSYGGQESVRRLSTELEAVRLQDRSKKGPGVTASQKRTEDQFIDLTSGLDDCDDGNTESGDITESSYGKQITSTEKAEEQHQPRRRKHSGDGNINLTSEAIEPRPSTRASERVAGAPGERTAAANIAATQVNLHAVQIYGATFRPGSNVELAGNCVLADGTPLRTTHFLRIHRLVFDTTSNTRLAYGELFIRQAHLGGIFPNKAGELVLINENAAVPIKSIMCKRKIIKTNRLWPECQIHRPWQVFDENGWPKKNDKGELLFYRDCADGKNGLLICRWRAEIKNDPLANTAKARWGTQGCIMRLRQEEADGGYSIEDFELFKRWRSGSPMNETETSSADDDSAETSSTPRATDLNAGSIIRPTGSPRKVVTSPAAGGTRDPGVEQAQVVIDLVTDRRKRRRSYPSDQKEEQLRNCNCHTAAGKSDFEHNSKRQKTSSASRGNATIFITQFRNNNSAGGLARTLPVSPRTPKTKPSNDETIRVPAGKTPSTPRKPKPQQLLPPGTYPKAPINIDGANQLPKRSKKPYTMGDMFCGGGGVSQGAKQAGLKIVFGVDFDAAAIDTYGRNHGRHISHHTNVNHFLTRTIDTNCNEYPDVLHMSPPCQTFSWAHTKPGQNDEKNEASFLVGDQALKVCRPRQVTLEETDALLSLPDSEYIDGRMNFSFFKGLINTFTSLGFSVRWGTLEGQEFGVCCKRRRLIIIASCPGETPARFPVRTHTTNKSALSCTRTNRPLEYTPTIGRAVAGIPLNASHHDNTPEVAKPLMGVASADDHYNCTIVTSGGGGKYLYHYNGLRKYTPRELACIMSFPPTYRFGPDLSNADVKKIVGNAVPPKLAEAIFVQVIKHLERTDAKYAALSEANDD